MINPEELRYVRLLFLLIIVFFALAMFAFVLVAVMLRKVELAFRAYILSTRGMVSQLNRLLDDIATLLTKIDQSKSGYGDRDKDKKKEIIQ